MNQQLLAELCWLQNGELQSNSSNGPELHSPFLEGLAKHSSEDILKAATLREMRAGSMVTNQDEAAEHLFMLVTGCARHFFVTPDGKKVLLLWLRPGDIIGGMALLPSASKYLVSSELVKDSSLAVWRRQTILALAAQHPRLLSNGLVIASEYMIWYIATHSALVSKTARQRLARVLIELSLGIGRQTAEGVELSLRNEELANAANVTPFTVSRLLNQWERKGALVKRRGRLMLCDLQVLADS